MEVSAGISLHKGIKKAAVCQGICLYRMFETYLFCLKEFKEIWLDEYYVL